MLKLFSILRCCILNCCTIFPLALLLLTAEANAVEQGLVERINQAKYRLNNTEKRINDERKKRVDQLNALEQEVLALQKKTAVARRSEDEKTLSLDTLQERLDKWKQQQVYQQNLLSQFLRQHAPNQANNKSLDENIATVGKLNQQIRSKLQPAWQERTVVLSNGEIMPLPTLTLGPITWYWQADEKKAGLAQNTADAELKSLITLDSGTSSNIGELYTEGKGDISFDPTLGRALTLEQNAGSPIEHIAKGGLWVIPILLAAFIAVIIALSKGLQLWRLPKTMRFTPANLQTLMQPSEPEPSRMSKMQRELLAIGRSETSANLRDDRLFIALGDIKSKLEYGIGAIAITASISPLLGLLGTVSGMIETFKMMTLFGSSDPEVVSGGIAQALVTTELGLIVAIPALILNALLSRRARTHYRELEEFSLLISLLDNPELQTTAIKSGYDKEKQSTDESHILTMQGVKT